MLMKGSRARKPRIEYVITDQNAPGTVVGTSWAYSAEQAIAWFCKRVGCIMGDWRIRFTATPYEEFHRKSKSANMVQPEIVESELRDEIVPTGFGPCGCFDGF